MQDQVLQSAMQPYVKLVQSNVELLTEFAGSPEVTTEAFAAVQNLYQQAQESTMKMLQSNAFARLMQGMVKNYTDFVTEWNQSAMAVVAQGQAAMVRQVEEVSTNVVDATAAQGRRVRQAA